VSVALQRIDAVDDSLSAETPAHHDRGREYRVRGESNGDCFECFSTPSYSATIASVTSWIAGPAERSTSAAMILQAARSTLAPSVRY
jgi:hypothetical protein